MSRGTKPKEEEEASKRKRRANEGEICIWKAARSGITKNLWATRDKLVASCSAHRSPRRLVMCASTYVLIVA
jgi:hypothetical protein